MLLFHADQREDEQPRLWKLMGIWIKFLIQCTCPLPLRQMCNPFFTVPKIHKEISHSSTKLHLIRTINPSPVVIFTFRTNLFSLPLNNKLSCLWYHFFASFISFIIFSKPQRHSVAPDVSSRCYVVMGTCVCVLPCVYICRHVGILYMYCDLFSWELVVWWAAEVGELCIIVIKDEPIPRFYRMSTVQVLAFQYSTIQIPSTLIFF